jgi:hypothetical protein
MIIPTPSIFKQDHALKVIPTHLFILLDIFTTYVDYCEVYDCLFERVNVILGMPASMRSDRSGRQTVLWHVCDAGCRARQFSSHIVYKYDLHISSA